MVAKTNETALIDNLLNFYSPENLPQCNLARKLSKFKIADRELSSAWAEVEDLENLRHENESQQELEEFLHLERRFTLD